MLSILKKAAYGTIVGIVLAIVMLQTYDPVLPGGTVLAADTALRAAREDDTPTKAERVQIILAASAVGALYYCNAREIYPNTAFQVGWAKLIDIFAPYEQFPGSEMYVGALYIQNIVREVVQTGEMLVETGNPDSPLTSVQVEDLSECRAAVETLKSLMAPGKVLDGKWAPGQQPA